MDELWRLEDDRHPLPQWSTYGIPELADDADISSEEEDDDDPPNIKANAGGSKGKFKNKHDVRPDALVRRKCIRRGNNPNRQAITAGQGDEGEDEDDMPDLIPCSSSEEGEEWGSDVESDYDSHEMRTLERLMKEAQDAASAGWKSGTGEKDSNPFIRLLSNLRGTSDTPDFDYDRSF